MKLDFLFVGGGLANSLAAYRMSERRPGVQFKLLERGPSLGGNHVWSFHDGDLTAAERAWVEPLVSHQWPQYEVRFPRFRRVIGAGYQSVESADFHQRVSAKLGDRIELGVDVVELTSEAATVRSGQTFTAKTVIDGRGFVPSTALGLGYQKFVGQVLEFDRPIDLAHPIVMDATVDQADGFRFVYVLPFSNRAALVEDTYYSDSPTMDTEAIQNEIVAYAERSGWSVSGIQREERGVLPITLSGNIDDFWNHSEAIPRIGLRAALFHPTTGYSFPNAVRAADMLTSPDALAADAYRLLRERSEREWKSGGFFRRLNRMLLLASEPGRRYRVLERFYALPEAVIARFYAARLTPFDRTRILAGKPPVPITAAVKALMNSNAGR